MAEESNKWIDVIAKLTKLTQEGQLKWNSQPSTLFINDEVQQFEIPFRTYYKDKWLRIYKKRSKVEAPSSFYAASSMLAGRKYPYWTAQVYLEIIDGSGNSLWTFPPVRGLDDLLTSVKYQAVGVKEFIEDILQDSEVRSDLNSYQGKIESDEKLKLNHEKLLNMLSGNERLLHVLLEAFSGRTGLLRESGTTLKSIFGEDSGTQIAKVEASIAHAGFRTDLSLDEEHGLWEVEATATDGTKVTIDWELVSRNEFHEALDIYKNM